MKSITVFIKKMDKQTNKDTETVDTDKNQDKKDEKEEKEEIKDADKSDKPEEAEKKKDEKVNGEPENGEKEKEDVTETKETDEFRVCGVSVSDEDGSYQIGNLAILDTYNPFEF